MEFGMCPNCINKLTEDSALVTGPSSIFKGNNVYMLCKNCQQVLLYNRDRDMIFDLDDYKEDEDVIEEINQLLERIDSHYEVAPQSGNCLGDCAQCAGCHDEQEYRRSSRKRTASEPVEPVVEEPVQEPEPELINQVFDYGFLAVNKADPSKKQLILEEELNLIKVDEWVFFELVPVTIKAVTTYEIERR